MVYLENVFPLTSTNTSPDVLLGKMMGRSGRQKVLLAGFFANILGRGVNICRFHLAAKMVG